MNKREWMLHTISLVYGSGAQLRDGINLPEFFSKMYDAICAASPETPQEGAWVEHDGDVSKAPPEGVMVEVMFRDGTLYSDSPDGISWDHVQEALDVVRWRYA